MTAQNRDVLRDALAETSTVLPDADARALRELATRTFTDGTAASVRTDALVGDAQVTCEDSWKLIEDFPATGPVVMFTNRADGETMLELPSVKDALAVRAALSPFDFYLVDRACTFLFAADEYDTLFGCGTAALYVAQL